MSESNAVFLSYASQDAEVARRLGESLKAAGIEVWIDTAELRGGDVWDQKIRRQIRDCALFMPIISSHTQARAEGYFRLEWRLADQRTHLMGKNRTFLVPVCTDDMREADADVPESFAAVQWTRLPDGKASPAFVKQVGLLLSPKQAATSASATAAARLGSGRVRPKIWLSVILLVISALTVGYWMFHRVQPRVQSEISDAASRSSAPAEPPSSVIPDKSVAVLAFVDMSEKKDQEYFSDGLTEEMIDLLSQLSDLRVPARTSSFYFKGKSEPIASIANQLKVATVLEGSVRKAGTRLRITAQLIRAQDGYHLWSQTYDRLDTDIFGVQDEIAKAVVTALQGKLVGAGAAAEVSRGTSNAESYNQYLLGRLLSRRDTLQGYQLAAEADRKSMSLDPQFGLAYADLGRNIAFIAEYTGERSALEEAGRNIDRAIALAPGDARVYGARSFLRIEYLWDWAGARADIEKALTLDPRSSNAQGSYASLLDTLGQLSEAITAQTKVTELDPLFVGAWNSLGLFALEAKDYLTAEAALDRALQLAPTSMRSLNILGMLRLVQNRSQEALATYRKIENEGYREAGVAMAEYSLGHTQESSAALQSLITNSSKEAAFQIAEVFAWRGDKDKSFEWLERAYRQRDAGMTVLKGDPLISSLRSDPRYKTFLVKMKLPQ